MAHPAPRVSPPSRPHHPLPRAVRARWHALPWHVRDALVGAAHGLAIPALFVLVGLALRGVLS